VKTYLVALAIGLLVGGIYGVLGVRSPAPPVVALLGLLGMLVGEQVASWVEHRVFDVRAITHVSDHLSRAPLAVTQEQQVMPHENRGSGP
jgi:XapX domain-containing protein